MRPFDSTAAASSRSAAWVRLRAGGAFVAVGAPHLYGERGVLALREKEGRKVERMGE